MDEINKYAEALEQALEENAWLKRKCGLPEDITIDMKDLKLARQGQMMQLKAMNNMLEEVREGAYPLTAALTSPPPNHQPARCMDWVQLRLKIGNPTLVCPGKYAS